jgi:choline kinase
MRAIILAAGGGRRLAAMGWDKPKCLLRCPQGTLLDNCLQSLTARGILEVVIVGGYRCEELEPVLAQYALSITTVVNSNYAATNTIHSLWTARQYLDDDSLLFNGDVWFQHGILDGLLASRESALAVEVKQCDAEEVKVVTNPAGRVIRIGKEIPSPQALGEHIGIGKLIAPAARQLAESLDYFNAVLKRTNLFYESALDAILDRECIIANPLGRLRAVEIDTPDDYQRAQQIWRAP